MKICIVDGCERPVHARGHCSSCYTRKYTSGELQRIRRPMRPRHKPVKEWFPNSLVETEGPLATPCRLWTGLVHKVTGYGKLTIASRTMSAHRLAWELENGSISRRKQVLHKCDVRTCCNPDHLYLGTQADNMRDASQRNRLHRGEDNVNAKLTEALVREARKRHEQGEAIRPMASSLNVSYATLQRAISGKAWKHVQ